MDISSRKGRVEQHPIRVTTFPCTDDTGNTARDVLQRKPDRAGGAA